MRFQLIIISLGLFSRILQENLICEKNHFDGAFVDTVYIHGNLEILFRTIFCPLSLFCDDHRSRNHSFFFLFQFTIFT